MTQDGGGEQAGYPSWWEADVVLHDGTTTHIRPICPQDADALQAFHMAQSERSTYLRFFAPMERLPERDLRHLVTVDHVDRVALVAVASTPPGDGADGSTGGAGEDVVLEEQIIGVARYDRIDAEEAEVAFNVSDAHQGRGLGSVLLEHLAAAARERGVRRFLAEVLPQNGRMIGVFQDAGYAVQQDSDDGIITLRFDIDPTDRSLAVMADREHRAEARSMRALLSARTVVVVGPGPERAQTLEGRMAAAALVHLEASEATTAVHAVGVPGRDRAAELRVAAGADDGVDRAVDGDVDRAGEDVDRGGGGAGAPAADAPRVRHHTTFATVLGPVDLAVVAVPPSRALPVVRALATLGVRGVVLMSSGFAERGPDGLERQRALLRVAHAAGMRLIGPASYGLVASGSVGRLNASLAAELPKPGRIGLFCQSAPLAVALLRGSRLRNLGVSHFVSAGHRADVSGNDVMQFWGEDEDTDVVGLYLESLGNPRKFSRVARRLALHKPVVAVTAGRSGQVVPPGHAVRETYVPRRAREEVLRQSGVVRVENTHQLLDVVQLLAHQPLPRGRRTGILASSPSVATLVAEAAVASGLLVSRQTVLLAEDAPADEVHARVDALYADPDIDVVVVVRIPTVGGQDPVLMRAVAEAAARTGRTTVACLSDLRGIDPALTATDESGRAWTVPAYTTPEDAAVALGYAAGYARWRARDHGRPLHPPGADTRAARRKVARWLVEAGGPAAGRPVAPGEAERSSAVPLTTEQTAELLRTVGIEVLPSTPVRDADEAVAAARRIGWPVALKTTLPVLRHRADLGGVRLDVVDEDELRAAAAEILALNATHADVRVGRVAHTGLPLEVQAMAPRGAAVVVRSTEDPLFGPILGFGLAGDAFDLLGDVSYGVPPLTDTDVADLVRGARAAPRLFGYRGLPALDVGALEDVISRVAVLADDLPELRLLELNPVVVAEQGVVVLAARATIAPAQRSDTARRLPRL